MKFLGISLLMLTMLLSGCNKTSRLGNPDNMPSNWLAMRYNAWQIKQLPEVHQKELAALQIKLANERQGQYYNFYGAYTPAIQDEIKTTSERLNQAYLHLAYSSNAILASLTPNLSGLSETEAERAAGIAVTNNANHRMLHDDVNRIILLDKPSMLSPYPVVDN